MKTITGSKLYDYIQCPHKVWRDVYGPKEEKITETNPFVELLWNRGVAHEDGSDRSVAFGPRLQANRRLANKQFDSAAPRWHGPPLDLPDISHKGRFVYGQV